MSARVEEPACPSGLSAAPTLSGYLRPVVVASLGESVASAARRLRDARVGCVVVTRADRPIGILTDRDLALRVVAEARDPSVTRVEEILTCDPLTLRDSDTIETAARCMKEHGVRRLPIIDADGGVWDRDGG